MIHARAHPHNRREYQEDEDAAQLGGVECTQLELTDRMTNPFKAKIHVLNHRDNAVSKLKPIKCYYLNFPF